jgi:hypothetical protein
VEYPWSTRGVPVEYPWSTRGVPRQVYRGSQPDKRAWASVDSSELVPGDVISVVREVRSGPPESTQRVLPEYAPPVRALNPRKRHLRVR